MEKKGKRIFKAILFALLGFFAFYGVYILGTVIGMTIGSLKMVFSNMAEINDNVDLLAEKIAEAAYSPLSIQLATFVAEILAILLGLLWYNLVYTKNDTSEYKKLIRTKVFKPITFVYVTLLAIGFYGVDALLSQLVTIISPQAGENFENMMDISLDLSSPMSWISVVILAPIAEELMFRGIIIRWIKEYVSMWGVIAISAIMFGIMHMNVMQSIYVLPLACALGFAAYKYESVLPAIGIHMLNNLIAMLMGIINFPSEGLVYAVLIACAVIGVGAAILIYRNSPDRKLGLQDSKYSSEC